MAIDNKTMMIIGAVVAVIAIAAAVVLVSNNDSGGKDKGKYVVYDGNGGTTDDGQKTINSTTTTVLPCMFTNGDSDFAGWNTEKNGTGATYQPDDNITLGVKLYAQWKTAPTGSEVTFSPNEFTDYFSISLVSSDGKETPIDNGGKYEVNGASFSIKLTVKSGYTAINFRDYILDVYNNSKDVFKACMFSVDCVNPKVTISKFEVSQDGKSAVAVVTGIEKGVYTAFNYINSQERNYIAYSGNGGTTDQGKGGIRVTDSALTPDMAHSFTKPPAGKTTLVGWNTAKDGTGTMFNIGKEVPVGFLLYAIWQ